MSVQPLNDLWTAAAGQPYEPAIGKNTQFTVGISLLFTGTWHCILCIHLDRQANNHSSHSVWLLWPEYVTPSSSQRPDAKLCIDPSLKNLPLIGVPASLAAGYI